ncbi:MAG: lipoprotein signal peptidase [Bacteroidales bacterium]|nr:lipoprotein signal peptidase [Bacteroidales bacterium]
MALNRGHKLTIIAAILLVIDQVSKILVKTNMTIGESISVLGDWFQILFIENPGMAFGMEFGGSIGKYFLTILRIVLVIVMIIYLRKLLKKGSEVPMGVCVGIMMVMVGALGNILDCMFYGILFGESTMMQVAQFLPEGGGYAPFFLGKVVDMLYFPLIDTTWPEWVPFVGGDSLIFFRPIFNFADSCITVGALYLMIFQWKFFSEK